MDGLRRIGSWFDERLHLRQIYASSAGHRIPSRSASWWYVFGSGTLVCLVVQIITGICLALVYVPSPNEAYASLEYLNYQQTLGWFLRAVHNWGSIWMVGLLTIHVIQVFPVRCVQVPARADLGDWLLPLPVHTGGRLHRSDHALRSGRVLGLQIGVSIMGPHPLRRPRPWFTWCRAARSSAPRPCRDSSACTSS